MPTHLRTKIAYNRLRESQLEALHSQEGFIIRTPRGREATEKAYKHLGKIKSTSQGELF